MRILKALRKFIPIVIPVAAAVKESVGDRRSSVERRHVELLSELNQRLEKQNSKWENFKLGLIRGAATAIGATLIAAIALTLLMRVINTVDDVPIIRDIIQETSVKETIEEQGVVPR